MLKKRWLVLRQQSSQGANRLQVFADRDAAVAADGRPLKQFLLADIVSITGVAPNRSHYGFTIQMADSSQLFVCDTGAYRGWPSANGGTRGGVQLSFAAIAES